QVAAFESAQACVELGVECIHAIDQWTRQVVEHFPGVAEVEPAAIALEQPHAELLFQRPQLQAYRRLAEEQRLGRARYRAQPRHLAKRSQLLQPAALVVVARVRTHRRGVAAAAPPAGSDDGADER